MLAHVPSASVRASHYVVELELNERATSDGQMVLDIQALSRSLFKRDMRRLNAIDEFIDEILCGLRYRYSSLTSSHKLRAKLKKGFGSISRRNSTLNSFSLSSSRLLLTTIRSFCKVPFYALMMNSGSSLDEVV